MDDLSIMKSRHSVRQYTDAPLSKDIQKELNEKAAELNQESGLHMQLFFNEPKCFDSLFSHYGKFSGVSNYLAIVGKKGSDLLGGLRPILASAEPKCSAFSSSRTFAFIEINLLFRKVFAGFGKNFGIFEVFAIIIPRTKDGAETPRLFLG